MGTKRCTRWKRGGCPPADCREGKAGEELLFAQRHRYLHDGDPAAIPFTGAIDTCNLGSSSRHCKGDRESYRDFGADYDLYLNGKKLCGILAESALLPDGKLNYLVVGIGVNVSTDSFPPELSEIATSLAAAGGEEINCNRLIAAILNEFRQVCAELENREYLEEYKLRSCVLGKSVQLIRGKESQEAFALDVDRDAHLVVRLPNGSIQTIRSGEISLKGDWR